MKKRENCLQPEVDFLVEIQETLSKIVPEKADTPEEAIKKVKERYDKAEIILNAEDCVGVSYNLADSMEKVVSSFL